MNDPVSFGTIHGSQFWVLHDKKKCHHFGYFCFKMWIFNKNEYIQNLKRDKCKKIQYKSTSRVLFSFGSTPASLSWVLCVKNCKFMSIVFVPQHFCSGYLKNLKKNICISKNSQKPCEGSFFDWYYPHSLISNVSSGKKFKNHYLHTTQKRKKLKKIQNFSKNSQKYCDGSSCVWNQKEVLCTSALQFYTSFGDILERFFECHVLSNNSQEPRK